MGVFDRIAAVEEGRRGDGGTGRWPGSGGAGREATGAWRRRRICTTDGGRPGRAAGPGTRAGKRKVAKWEAAGVFDRMAGVEEGMGKEGLGTLVRGLAGTGKGDRRSCGHAREFRGLLTPAT